MKKKRVERKPEIIRREWIKCLGCGGIYNRDGDAFRDFLYPHFNSECRSSTSASVIREMFKWFAPIKEGITTP